MVVIKDLWAWIVDMKIATNEELQLITTINGAELETLSDVLYARTGYRCSANVEKDWIVIYKA